MSVTVQAMLGPSGQTLVVFCTDGAGQPSNVQVLGSPAVVISGDGTGAKAYVSGWDGNGGITQVTVYAAGTGYTTATATLSGGLGLGASLGVVTLAGGKVTSIPVAVAGVDYGPTYSVNGGTPTGLTDPLWGMDSASASPTPYLPWVLFPLPAPLAATDHITLDLPDGWLRAVAGTVTGATALAVSTAKVGGTFLPAFSETAKTMRIGAGANSCVNYQVENYYANVLKQAKIPNEDGVTGYPTVFPSFTPVVFWQTDTPAATATDPLGQPSSAPDGNWTVLWGGDYNANLTITSLRCSAQSLVSDTRDPSNLNHTRVYRLTADPAQTHHPGNVNLHFGAAGATNVRVYPPGEATDGSQPFGVNYLRQFGDLQCIRYMGVLGTNGSTVVEFSDFSHTDQLSYYAFGYKVGGTIASLDPYTPTDNWFDQTTFPSFVVTFTAPHNARTGQVLVFGTNITGPNADGSFPTTTGGTLAAKGVRGRHLPVRVIDSLRVAVEPWSNATGTLTGSVPQPAGATLDARIRDTVPPLECVQLSNAAGADAWMNIPHGATTDCITQMAQVVATNLAAGKKCYLEFSNEQWNTSIDYEQNQYLTQYGRNFPGSGAAATATVGSNGQLSGLTLTAPGSGYVMAPVVTIAPPPGGTHTATAHCTLINGVLAVYLDGAGQGYDPANPPAVTFQAGRNTTIAYLYLAARAHAIFAAEFAAVGRSGDLVRVVGSQYENPSLTQTIALNAARNGITFDALCVATYWSAQFQYGSKDEVAFDAAFDHLAVEMIHDFTQLNQIYGPFYAPLAGHRANLDANGYQGVELVTYEGGPVYGAPYGTNDINRRSYEWARHPRMREVMLYFLQRQQDAGLSLYIDLILMGNLAAGINWPTYFGRLQVPGLGDGSDGLHDNRTDYFDQSKVVSVKGHAMKTWGQLASGGGPPPPPPYTRRRQLVTNRSRRAGSPAALNRSRA